MQEDRTARDALRKLSATSVSPAMSRLTHAWMQLVINTDASLSTSFEQDERFAQSLRDSLLRLREIEDDRDQVAFELAQAREARLATSDKFAAQRARLEAQLRDTKRATDDILGPTAREREDFLQAAMSNFETHNSSAHEQLEAMQRTLARVTQASQQAETDERKHTQHDATELRELVERYDDGMDKLQAAIAAERAELARLDAANAKFELYFARTDKDRRNQLEEQRAMDLAERLRRSREANLFQLILKIQAVVRGFLARRRLRRAALRKKRRTRRKGRKGKKRTSTSPRRKKAVKQPSGKVRAKKA
jgi:PIN domain nuclease of toxin-antitoxin system